MTPNKTATTVPAEVGDKPAGRPIPVHTATALPPGAGDEPAGRPIPEHPDALLYTAEVAFLRGQSPRTVEGERLKGGGCPFIRLGRKAVRYRLGDHREYIAARLRKSTSDPGQDSEAPASPAGD